MPTTWFGGRTGTEITAARLNDLEGRATAGAGAATTAATALAAAAAAQATADAAAGGSGVTGRAPAPTGVAATDTAALQAALTAMSAGDQLIFRGGTYSINAPLVPKAGVTLTASKGSVISQVTQYNPVFDLFNVGNITIGDGFTFVNAGGPPPTIGPLFRGSNKYAYSCGVWANTGGNTIGDLRIIDFGVGVVLTPSDGVTANGDSVKRIGNRVGNLEVSGCNFGVLYWIQDGLRIGDLYCHDFVDSTAGVNPTHAIYQSGDSTHTCTNISAGDCLTVNNSTGHAYQFKYAHGLSLGNLRAVNCAGLFNIMDSFDVTGGNLTSLGDTCTLASLLFQTVTDTSARINLGTVTIDKTVELNISTATIVCDDAYFAGLVVRISRAAAFVSTNVAEVSIRGQRVTVAGLKLRNTGSGAPKAVGIGYAGFSVGDVTVSGLEVDGYANLVQVESSTTGMNVIDYAPAAQRRIAFRLTNYIDADTGSPAFRIVRRENTNTYLMTGQNTAYPLPALETITRLEVQDGNPFLVQRPTIGLYAGLVHDIAIHNGGSGALGAITWSTSYFFRTAFVTPLPSETTIVRFMCDGTNWREISRTALAGIFDTATTPVGVGATQSGNAVLNVGSTATAGTPTLGFRSSGLAPTYDSRLYASGGNSTDGSGGLQIHSQNVTFGCFIRPLTNATYDLGTSSLKWKDLYLTGVVKTAAVATGSRPTAASAGVGGMMFDSTLSKPIWSDGTTWRDAAGTAV